MDLTFSFLPVPTMAIEFSTLTGLVFVGGLLTILGRVEGGAAVGESEEVSDEGSDGEESERIEGDMGLGVGRGEVEVVIDVVIVVVSVVAVVVVAVVVVVVVVVVLSGRGGVAGVIVVTMMGKMGVLVVVVGDISEAEAAGFGPNISFRRSWSSGLVGWLDGFIGSMEISFGKSMSSSPSELIPESTPLCCRPVRVPVSRARS